MNHELIDLEKLHVELKGGIGQLWPPCCARGKACAPVKSQARTRHVESTGTVVLSESQVVPSGLLRAEPPDIALIVHARPDSMEHECVGVAKVLVADPTAATAAEHRIRFLEQS